MLAVGMIRECPPFLVCAAEDIPRLQSVILPIGLGLPKVEGMSDVSLLEHSVREDLNKTAQRVMGVLDPLKVVITNYPEGRTEELEAINNPEDPGAGTRSGAVFKRTLY
jgi:glutaminyl-tRNA synthetase